MTARIAARAGLIGLRNLIKSGKTQIFGAGSCLIFMFFEKERQNFFRPLNSRRRELVVACLRTLYDRLHGPAADYSSNLTREHLRDLLYPIVQDTGSLLAMSAQQEDDELNAPTLTDDQQITAAVIRSFLKDGWIEGFADRAGLVTAYRFTRPGKLFAEALWVMERPRSRARQRNMRSCRNSLEAVLRSSDAYDLIDAYDHAQKVISDLSEGVDYFQELVRRLMSEASGAPWDEFMEFLDRFERDFKNQLTADNVARHWQSIRETVGKLRNLDEAKYQQIERQLDDAANWAREERSGNSTFEWLLDRIEEMVDAACAKKQPEMIKAMGNYMGRASAIVQQAMMLRSGYRQQAFVTAIKHVSSLEGAAQDAFLEQIGAHLSSAEVRLLDPASFRVRTVAQRRKALTVTVVPKMSREARLAAALNRAEGDAFAVSNDQVTEVIRAELLLRNRPFRLSSLPTVDAVSVLQMMQSVEAIRVAGRSADMIASKLPSKLMTDYYVGSDYQIEFKDHAIKSS